MSSLQSIMNVDEDQHDASTSTPMDKKDKDAATPASGFRGQDPSTLSPPSHVIRSGQQPSSAYTTSPTPTVLADSNIARSGQQPTETDKEPGPTSAVDKGKGRAETSDSRTRTSVPTTISTTSSRPEGSRRQSTTSVDSMDQHGYGSASSSSLGGVGGGGLPPNHPTRPMGSPNPEVPIRLTPITGRVSRAKKGVPVHTCDMCNPPKTFTRAEHLRRHQLSHQTPRYPCNYPGCDRAFHRPDLLLRHQQRHDQEGDKASRSGGDSGRRDSTASGASASLDERMPRLQVGGSGLQPPPGFHSVPAGFGGPSTPSSTSDMPPSTPNLGNAPFQQGGSPAPGGSGPTMSPQIRDRYGPSSGPGPRGTYGFPLHPGMHGITSSGSISPSPEPTAFSNIEFVTPRTFCDPTQDLEQSASLQTSLDNPPELVHTEYSPWTSASESNYSTPPSDITRSRRLFDQHRSQGSLDWQANTGMLQAFHGNAHSEIHGTNGSLETVAASHYATAHFHMSPHLASAPFPAYGPLLMTGFPDDQTQHSMLDPSITALHHRSSSVRSPTPPPSSAQAADTLVTPAPLSIRIDPMGQVSRQKAMVLGGGNMTATAPMLGGDGSSPSWASNSPGGVLTGSALGGAGGCGIGGMTMVTPLPRSVRNAVPGYIEVYWDRFHPFYPFVHRQSVEGAGADVLKCAMAAMGTQYLNSKEDRIRGNQLHEYSWQEAKRCPPWDLQAMQAIVLCECFARFRGRKAAVRPSKLFESLYSRVSGSESFVSSASDGDCFSIPVSLSDSSSIPSSFSSSSSTSLCTPTLPAWSPQTSASSPDNGTYAFDHITHDNTSLTFSPTVSFSSQQISSSPDSSFLFGTSLQAYNNVSIDNTLFSFSSVGQGQSYSNIFSQALDHNPNMYTAALGHDNMELQRTNEERWHTWLDEETRRRLLSVCFVVDNHASMYHQQPRARNDVDPSTIALTGPSDVLWAASSADEWAATLVAHPAAGIPQYLPHPNTLTPEDVARHSYLDQVAILHAEAIRLPRRHYGRPTGDKDGNELDNNSPVDLRTPTTASFGQNFKDTRPEDRIAHLFSKAPMGISANVYLALHYTPLHDLLAVSGDSYVFCQKVVHAPTYLEHRKRLRAWAEGRSSFFSATATRTSTNSSPTSAHQQQGLSPVGYSSSEGMQAPARATIHAARALVGFLDRGLDPKDGVTPYITCISNYWGMYVCALIIWAYGQHRTPAAGRTSTSSSSTAAPGNGNGNGNGGSNNSSPNKGGAMGEEDTIAWLRQVSEASAPEQLGRMRGRREASAGVVSMVRRRLEADCVGPRSQLYVDAVSVLKKLEEGVSWRWF